MTVEELVTDRDGSTDPVSQKFLRLDNRICEARAARLEIIDPKPLILLTTRSGRRLARSLRIPMHDDSPTKSVTHSNSAPDDTDADTGRDLKALVAEVRRFTARKLKAGRRQAELSFAMAFVATEMGLFVTRGQKPLTVVATVLRAVETAAAARAEERSEDTQAGEITVPPGASLH